MVDRLKRAKAILDSAGIPFWLDCGTLLGAVREGRFIPWDHDIDLGIWDVHRAARDACVSGFKADGWKIYAHHPWTLKVRLDGQPPAGLDIHCYDERDDKAIMMLLNLAAKFLNYWLHVLPAPYDYEADLRASYVTRGLVKIGLVKISRVLPSSLRKWLVKILSWVYERIASGKVWWAISSHYFKELSTIRFYGMEFRVPAETAEYLTYRYGEDWDVPKRNWITERDDGTVCR